MEITGGMVCPGIGGCTPLACPQSHTHGGRKMLTYTFVFKRRDGTVAGRRPMRVADRAALAALIEKAAEWNLEGRQAYVYGPGIKTVRCCKGTALQVERGRLAIPLQ